MRDDKTPDRLDTLDETALDAAQGGVTAPLKPDARVEAPYIGETEKGVWKAPAGVRRDTQR